MPSELAPFIVRVLKGTRLFEEGDSGTEMYFVQQGKVRIEKQLAGKPQTLAVMEKGDFFGEMAVIEQVPRTASAVVEEDAELLKIDAQNFEKLLQGNIEIAVRMIRKYAARLRDTNEKLAIVVRDRKQVDEEIEQIIKSVKKPTSETKEKAIA